MLSLVRRFIFKEVTGVVYGWFSWNEGSSRRSNREKLRKEAGATVLAARRTWFWMEAAASATLASARGQKRALYYRLYPVTQIIWALKRLEKY